MNYQEIEHYAAEMLPHYLECCAWSTGGTDSQGTEHESFEGFSFSENAKKIALLDCMYFVRSAHPWLSCDGVTIDASESGHNLWLSREGHGAGFWDRGYKYGDVLHSKAELLGSGDAYLSNDNEIGL